MDIYRGSFVLPRERERNTIHLSLSMDGRVRAVRRPMATVSQATDPSESESRVRTFVPRDFDGVFPLGAGLFKKDLANRGGFQAVVPLYPGRSTFMPARKTDPPERCHNLKRKL